MTNRSPFLALLGRRRCAFTLIELLVVIAVIGIFASLLLPALSSGKSSAVRMQCLSNLRQIGLSTQLYADDHSERLPGPLHLGQYSDYDVTSTNQLVYHLAPYLALAPPSAQTNVAPLFMCPAFRRVAPKGSTAAGRVSLVVNPDIDPDPPVIRPFGTPANDRTPPQNPLKIAGLETYGSPAETLAITDVDRQNIFQENNPWWGQLPGRPVHGRVRNELYFDWHVAAKRAVEMAGR